jgi:RNA polymerase sigma factor (sigma-70 family)
MGEAPAPIDTLYRDLRPHAFAVAYRMLGTVSDAEDIVQDAFVRLQEAVTTDRTTKMTTEITSPKAYVTTVITRLAIDRLRSARVRRETYFGPWLPEPVVGPRELETEGDPTSLSMAVMVLLESLSPVERAVFVLREAFAQGYDEIAQIVGKTTTHCRQIATRARQHVDARRPRFETSPERRDQLAGRFLQALTAGDRAQLTALLAEDAAFHGDGGGKAKAFPRPIAGREAVIKVLAALFASGAQLGVRCEAALINGQPGALVRDADDRLITVLSFDLHADGTVHTVRSIVNPEKLGHLGALSAVARSSGPTRAG